MKHNAVVLGSALTTLVAAFVAAYSGQLLLGFGLFLLTVTPLPGTVGYWLHDSIVHATRCFRGSRFRRANDHGQPRKEGT